MELTRSLLTFAFVADSFSRTGDITSGFEPLFSPILQKMKGQTFDPKEFARAVEETWGVFMHPYVALDLAPKLATQGLLHPLMKSNALVGYTVANNGQDYIFSEEANLDALIKEFFEFSRSRLSNHGLTFSDDDLEEALYKRLVTMDFLAVIARDQPSFLPARTLSLKKQEPPPGPEDPALIKQAHLDYLCADFVEQLYRSDESRFELLANVSCGALLSEVVLGLRNPPATGQDASELSIYFDSPFIMDLLGLSDVELRSYAELLFQAAKASKARLRCFAHNIEEIQANIDAPLANLERHTEVFGPTGRLLLQGSSARAYVVSIRRDVGAAVTALGIEVDTSFSGNVKPGSRFYTSAQEDELSSHLGMYQNVYARLRDAASIANVIRIRADKRTPKFLFSSGAVFVTRNPRLAARARQYLSREILVTEESIPAVITDRYLAGVLWIAQGGRGQEMPRRRLLANCMTAMLPRRDVVTKMYKFLSEIDETKAEHFEALVANNRCGHYLMEQTLGDRDLLTIENCQTIYENIERATAEKVIREKDSEIIEIKRGHAEALSILESKNEELAGKLEIADTSIGELEIKANSLLENQNKQEAERRRRDLLIVSSAIEGIYRFHRNVLVGLSLILSAASIGSGIFISEWGALGLILAVPLGAIGFWRVPDFLFGAFLDERCETILIEQLRKLGVEIDVDALEIDWSRGTFTQSPALPMSE